MAAITATLGSCSSPPDSALSVDPGGEAPVLSEWTPTTEVVAQPLTDAEKDEVRAQFVEANRDTLGVSAEIAIPDLVRWTTPAEQGAVIAECLNDAGVPATLMADGSTLDFQHAGSSQIPDNSALQLWLCYAKFTPEAETLLPPTLDQQRVRYEYWTEFYVPCIEQFGVQVAELPPNKETWVASIMHTDSEEIPWMPTAENWDAESSARLQTDQDWATLVNQTCPVEPPAQFYYGS